jgi:methionine-rich copper-binding protein CopC
MTGHPNRFGTRWRTRALAVVLAVTALLVGAATAAQAHNILVGTSPADLSTVAVVPAQVTLTFDQPALAVGTEIIVTGPAGQVQSGAAVLVNNTVAEHLRPGAAAGRYTVLWRVTSADSHTVSGRFSFTASSPSPGRQPNAPTSTTSTTSGTSGHASTLWWGVAGGALFIFLLVVIVIARKPRTTPHGERDPQS